MSTEPDPSPPPVIIPRGAEPFQVAVVAPLAPLNALPLDYVPPSQVGRPGVITAIGVLSIIVAAISGIASLMFGFAGFGMLMVSQIKIPVKTTINSSASVNAAGAKGPARRPVVGPHGLEEHERSVVSAALNQEYPLSEMRSKMLDLLLAEAGQDLFPFRGDGLTASAIAASISDFGQVHKLGGEPGPDYFVLGNGRLELFDDHAVFLPRDGREPVRVSEEDVRLIPGRQLSRSQVRAVVEKIQAMSGNKFNQAQTTRIALLLTAADQQWIDLSLAAPPAAQIRSVIVQPDGSGTIQTTDGVIIIDAAGVVTYQLSSKAILSGAGRPSPFKVSAGAAVGVMIASLASIALAIYLLVIGILTLRQSRRAGKLHLIYAAIKIPLAILAAVCVYWMATSVVTNLPLPLQPAPQPKAIGISYAMLALVGIVYPIALLIALRTRRLREYYAGVS